MAAKVIAFANHKGGVGKTASTVNVAYCLAKRKRRVLVVDCDPQGNASLTLGTVSPYEQPRTVANLFTGLSFSAAAVPSKYEGLELIPANLNVYATVSTLSNSIKRFFGFRQALDKAALETYDYILLDCPPTIEGALLTNALVITDYIIIPRGRRGYLCALRCEPSYQGSGDAARGYGIQSRHHGRAVDHVRWPQQRRKDHPQRRHRHVLARKWYSGPPFPATLH